jgi:tRNA threonylcarbamoyladenosine biosynthesis protein TsaB
VQRPNIPVLTKAPFVIVLALETSAVAGSVALLHGDQVLAERLLDPARRSAQTLAPALAEALAAATCPPADVHLVAAVIGPGSFTGLRVGVTTAKTFAYAARAAVLGLNTLDVIAAQVPLGLLGGGSCELHAIIDAQRKELFVGRFRAADGEIERIAADAIVPIETWLQSLRPGVIVTGPMLERLEGQLPPGVIAVDASLREPRAATVGRLAWRDYGHGRRDDLWKLAPQYGRASAAEEKAAKAIGAV